MVGLGLSTVLLGLKLELELGDGLALYTFGGGPEDDFGEDDEEDPDEDLLPLLRFEEEDPLVRLVGWYELLLEGRLLEAELRCVLDLLMLGRLLLPPPLERPPPPFAKAGDTIRENPRSDTCNTRFA